MGGPGSGRRPGGGKYSSAPGFPHNKIQHLRETRNALRGLLKKYSKLRKTI